MIVIFLLYVIPLIVLYLLSKYSNDYHVIWQSKELMLLPLANLIYAYFAIAGICYNYVRRKFQ